MKIASLVTIPIIALSIFGSIEIKAEELQKKGVLTLSKDPTPLLSELELKYDRSVGQLSYKKNATGAKDDLENNSILHIDLSQFNENDFMVNQYISEAMKQEKIIVLENTATQNFSSIPFLTESEVMVIKPSLSNQGDEIISYSGTIKSDSNGTQVNSNDSISDKNIILPLNTATKIEQEIALKNVVNDIDSLSSSNKKDIFAIQSISGGDRGYGCPSEARTERLCYVARITNTVFNTTNTNHNLNLLYHYTLGMFRTLNETLIAISPYGSSNVNMYKNDSAHRGYFLEKVEVTVEPYSMGDMNLDQRKPGNANSTGALTSTSGISFSIEGSASTDPSLGASIGYSESNSTRIDITNWETTTNTNGQNAKWTYKMKTYGDGEHSSSWSSIVKEPLFKLPVLRSLTAISANGLQYTAEVLYSGSRYTDAQFGFHIYSKSTIRNIWFTERSIFHWKASTNSYWYSRYVGGLGLNTSWLKNI